MTNPHTPWHFVRCSDLETRERLWVDSSTNCVMNAVEIARHGRAAHSNGHTARRNAQLDGLINELVRLSPSIAR